MRNAFAREITRLAQADERIALLSGDIGNRLFDPFKAARPDRFFNCGVAEANMTGVAAGLALGGLKPVTYTIAPFNTVRCLEQIRLDVCYPDLPVVVVGVGAGLAYASLGSTHHALEDVAVLRTLPNLAVLCPADAVETGLALEAALTRGRPAYIRLGKKNEPAVHAAPPEFRIGRGILLREGGDACILGSGVAVAECLKAADLLAGVGVAARVVSMPTVKPLDEELLAEALDRYPVVAVVEEHGLVGGLGSAVAEWAVDHGARRAAILRFGTPDSFLHGLAGQAHGREVAGLTATAIARRVAEALGAGA